MCAILNKNAKNSEASSEPSVTMTQFSFDRLVVDCAVDAQWRDVFMISDMGQRLAEVLDKGLAHLNWLNIKSGTFELSLQLVTNETMRILNKKWRGQDRPTNVLSFPAFTDNDTIEAGAPILLGDIVLAKGVIVDEVAMAGRDPLAHLSHLAVHGLLHLCGYDHIEEAQAETMEALEIAILGQKGFPSPYIDRDKVHHKGSA